VPASGETAPSSRATTRAAHVATWLGVIAVPALGWFTQGWSGATTLVVYWFETAAMCLLIVARIALHQRWTPRYGHFRYQAPVTDRRGVPRRNSFVSGFALTSLVFCGAHALFLGVILLLLNLNGQRGIAEVDWRSIGLGCAYVLAFLLIEFLLDLSSLRHWTFWQIEQTANRGLSRVVVIHLTLIFGLFGVAITDAPSAFFGVFVVLKSLAALSLALPQWDPEQPPRWFSRVMNRVPNVHPGKRFEDFWAESRAASEDRRAANERPWTNRS
jgi:hypothetical protein